MELRDKSFSSFLRTIDKLTDLCTKFRDILAKAKKPSFRLFVGNFGANSARKNPVSLIGIILTFLKVAIAYFYSHHLPMKNPPPLKLSGHRGEILRAKIIVPRSPANITAI
jgi:hypothetical protein